MCSEGRGECVEGKALKTLRKVKSGKSDGLDVIAFECLEEKWDEQWLNGRFSVSEKVIGSWGLESTLHIAYLERQTRQKFNVKAIEKIFCLIFGQRYMLRI